MSAIQALLEWCDRNMHSNYPVLDTATCLSNSGVYLPSSFLVDFQMVVANGDIEDLKNRFYISKIARTGDSFLVEVSFYAGNGDTFPCAMSAPIPITTSNIESIGDRTFALSPNMSTIPQEYEFLRSLSGYFIVGTCIDMATIGTLTFGFEATQLMGLRVYVATTGIQSVTFRTVDEDGTTRDTTLYNDFTITAGDGIEFQIGVSGGETVVVIHRVPTAEEAANDFASVSEVLDAVYTILGNPIRRLNGIMPDQNGDFVIKGTDCLTIDNMDHGLLMANPCGKPCCADTQADPSDLFASELKRLQAYYEAISNNVNAIQARLAALIASRG